MSYDHQKIERYWQNYWTDNQTFKADNDSDKMKYYVLDMFPYPSGAKLHVGHPLGYIASDIVARYKRLKGFNVLHPMGFDAYGLPAEQYAIQTGQHPAVTTEVNIQAFKKQLEVMGFSFDWSREVRTSDPDYYKWTQWIFLQLFDSWYNPDSQRAEPISSLIENFKKKGTAGLLAAYSQVDAISSDEWNKMGEPKKQEILLNFRLAFLADTMVNWCPKLGTVLSNDEVVDGVSARGGYPVERKSMRQWSLRITAYADRLLKNLDKLNWPESIKEIQRNWIGKSEGALIRFDIFGSDNKLEVFTTRPDTIFGATFMVLAPEHPLVEEITENSRLDEMKEYVHESINRAERDRISEVKSVTGRFTGAYAINPFTKQQIPIWVADYVLYGYGTGAIMAVPAHDSRDHAFAKKFNIPIVEVVAGGNVEEEAFEVKNGKLINSDFITGMQVADAISAVNQKVVEQNLGSTKVNYRIRDAVFGRQRYWGEPFPIYYAGNLPASVAESDLPVLLPEIDKFLPTEDGDPPLGRAVGWKYKGKHDYELTTMPGWAGSSWYFLRYMDPDNKSEFVARETVDYWKEVDLYIGGAEHATGHLLYARFWNLFLYDRGWIGHEEPFARLVNQGMILGQTAFVYRISNENKFVSSNLKGEYKTQPIRVDVGIVNKNYELNLDKFREWRPEFKDAEFILENGKYHCGSEAEKMSKTYYNTVSPDEIIEQYGADTFRMYEMFMGPLEQYKPWSNNGIEGVYKFLKRLHRLFYDDEGMLLVVDEIPNEAELKVLHKTIKKVEDDIGSLSFNTSVSAFMVCVNDLMQLDCHKRLILKDLIILISPFAPHLAEELWNALGNMESISYAEFPSWNPDYIKNDTVIYPVSFNGKMRFKLELPADLSKEEVEQKVLEAEDAGKWLNQGKPRKVIVVPGKIVNVVI